MRCHRHYRACIEIHRLLRFIRKVRRAVLHLRDLGTGIMRVHPVRVWSLLLALAVHLTHRFAVLRIDARIRCQTLQIRHIAFACIAPHYRLHGRVGFERGRVNADGFALQRPCSATCFSTQLNTAWCVSLSISRLVRDTVT